MNTDIVSSALVYGSVALQAATVAGIACLLGARRVAACRRAIEAIVPYAMRLMLVIAVASVLGSMYYSHIAGFEPCSLCWWQRVFLFPQVVLIGMALVRRERNIVPYLFALSLIGIAIAGYNQYLQFGGDPLIPCAPGEAADACSKRYIFELGYMTIPMMSLASFSALAVLSYASMRNQRTAD